MTSSGVTHSGNTITGNFPLAAVHGLGKGHLMSAFSDADGREYQASVAGRGSALGFSCFLCTPSSRVR